ncbi:MAG: MBL fold metallo-hydrolase, partial [Candidatus Omnitrophica bacterium]|nr:MBL fold metallo-hydrolase [Candidatus Omnitrophota bacterium]
MVKVKSLKGGSQGKGESSPDFIKFLGTAGARFVMIKQLRASAGLWISCQGTNVIIDPGPGSIVHCAKSRPKLDPSKLDAVILTHRHLDHCGDVNVMIEAMTEGGFKKRGLVFCPQDALEGDPVIFKYLRNFPKEIIVLKKNKK